MLVGGWFVEDFVQAARQLNDSFPELSESQVVMYTSGIGIPLVVNYLILHPKISVYVMNQDEISDVVDSIRVSITSDNLPPKRMSITYEASLAIEGKKVCYLSSVIRTGRTLLAVSALASLAGRTQFRAVTKYWLRDSDHLDVKGFSYDELVIKEIA